MLYQQARLHDRGAAEMVLQMISASKGRKAHIHTHSTICLPSAAFFGLTAVCLICDRQVDWALW